MPSHYKRKQNLGSSATSESSPATARTVECKKAKIATFVKDEYVSDNGERLEFKIASGDCSTPVNPKCETKYYESGDYQTVMAYGTRKSETKGHKRFLSAEDAESAGTFTSHRRSRIIELQPVPRGPKIKFSGQPAFWLPVKYKGPIDVKYAVAIQAPSSTILKNKIPDSRAKYRLSQ